jgi:hypothetical protein
LAITGTSGIGEVRMLGALPRGGLGVTGSANTPGSDPIRMVLHVGIGSIEVDRQSVAGNVAGKQGDCRS